MKNKNKQIGRIIFYGLFALFFVFLTAEIFFANPVGDLIAWLDAKFDDEISVESDKDLNIVFAEEPEGLEVTKIDRVTRQLSLNVFEPLVRPDANLKIRPALALSWGIIDDLTWEFNLRPDVKFHDGSEFDAEDVLASFERAIEWPDSEIADSLSTVRTFEIVDDLTLRLETKQPDPLLLQKLSMLLIVPSEFADNNTVLVGTAPFAFVDWDKGEELELEYFYDYWGDKPDFIKIKSLFIPDKNERVSAVLNDEADFLSFVPFDAVEVLESKGLMISTVPSLEVQMLFFNLEREFFAEKSNREAVALALNQDGLVEKLGRFARPVTQFVSNGVFGFNPKIAAPEYDLLQAKKLVDGGETIHFHLPVGLTALGEHVRLQLKELGLFVVVSYFDLPDLFESIENSEADIYFLGFKSDLGDSADLFHDLLQSDGEFNVSNFENDSFDELISLAAVELDEVFRLSNLQRLMKIAVEDEIVGFPLFEYENVYAFDPGLKFSPRLDGFIYFDQIEIK